jgi:hypothetical protein
MEAGEGKTFFSREKEVFPFPLAPILFQEKRDIYGNIPYFVILKCKSIILPHTQIGLFASVDAS